MTPLTAPRLFVAYPSAPTLRVETIRNGAKLIATRAGLDVTVWQDLQVGGRVMINEIHEAIDRSSVVVAEVSGLNQNVLYEQGSGKVR